MNNIGISVEVKCMVCDNDEGKPMRAVGNLFATLDNKHQTQEYECEECASTIRVTLVQEIK